MKSLEGWGSLQGFVEVLASIGMESRSQQHKLQLQSRM